MFGSAGVKVPIGQPACWARVSLNQFLTASVAVTPGPGGGIKLALAVITCSIASGVSKIIIPGSVSISCEY